MRVPVRLAAVLLVALAVPATASAADPWSLPAPIRAQTTTPPLPTAPGLAANAHGLALAVADTGGASPDIGPHTLASVFSAGTFTDPRALTPANVAMGPGSGRVLPYAQSRLLGAGISRGRSSSQAVVAFGRIDANGASLDAPRGLGPADLRAASATLAVNDRGDAAVVYAVCREHGGFCSRVLVYLAVRRAGTSAFRSTRIDDDAGRIPQLAAAVNDRGDAMAVWTKGGSVLARLRTAGGTLRARQRVGATVAAQHLAPSAVLSTHRAQFVGWLAQGVSEGQGGTGTAWAAQARDGGTFTAIRLGTVPALPAGGYVSEAGVRVGYGTQSRSLVAWTDYDGAHFVVRRAQIRGAANNPSQTLIAQATLSPAGVDAVLSDFVANPSGAERAVMLSGLRGHDPSTPGGAVGVLASGGEEIAPAAAGPAQPVGAVATLLSDRRVLAAWTTVGQGDSWSVRAGPTQ